MGSPTSVTTENPELGRQGGVGSRRTSTAATDDAVDAAYCDERLSQGGPWPSEVPPTGVLPGMLGEMTVYYGACWLHHRCSAQRRGKTR